MYTTYEHGQTVLFLFHAIYVIRFLVHLYWAGVNYNVIVVFKFLRLDQSKSPIHTTHAG